MGIPTEIKNVSEITIEQAKQLKTQGVNYITIEDSQNGYHSRVFDPEDIVEIKKAIKEFLKGMPELDKKDPDYEKKVFSYIYVKLALTVKYDTLAAKIISKPGYALDEKKGAYVNTASCLYGALVNKQAICSGLSDALRNILAEVGIRAKYISGGPNKRGEKHAWNQVCLDGEWFNCDVTNDAGFFKKGLLASYFLVSDKDYDLMKEYPPRQPECRVKTTARSLYPDEQWKLTCGVLKVVKQEIKDSRKKPEFVSDIAQKVTEKKSQRGK